MRRIIASVSNFTDLGDVTTLANPEMVEQIRHHVQAEKLARGEVPRELTEAEKQEIQRLMQNSTADGTSPQVSHLRMRGFA